MSLGTAVVAVELVPDDILFGVLSDLRRLGRGEFRKEGGKWCPFLFSEGGGVVALVIFRSTLRMEERCRTSSPQRVLL